MAKKIGIPWEFKYKLAMRGWSSILGGFLYAIREKYGAPAALEIIERLYKMDDRVKNLANFIKDVFKIEGNDAEAIGKWFDVWYEICEFEYTTLEQSKTLVRSKVTKCPWKIAYKDIDWCLIWADIIYKTINPKAIHERPKAMCAGDPYCEHITRIEE